MDRETEKQMDRETEKQKNGFCVSKFFSSSVRAKRGGFTLLELLLVIAVSITIAALTIPVGIRFFQTQTLDETTAGILETLRRAQNQAIFQKNDSAFGVKFLSDSYVLFQGNSYGEIPSEDESFSLPSGITTGGIDEVVFSKLTGIPDPSGTGTLTITLGNNSASININAQGNVEKL